MHNVIAEEPEQRPCLKVERPERMQRQPKLLALRRVAIGGESPADQKAGDGVKKLLLNRSEERGQRRGHLRKGLHHRGAERFRKQAALEQVFRVLLPCRAEVERQGTSADKSFRTRLALLGLVLDEVRDVGKIGCEPLRSPGCRGERPDDLRNGAEPEAAILGSLRYRQKVRHDAFEVGEQESLRRESRHLGQELHHRAPHKLFAVISELENRLRHLFVPRQHEFARVPQELSDDQE
mmetsp:Transcript_30071/g.97905  ORF Transcript_30071/g.97905 Transcript_30071/m.97905 type:complete len:237 (-) Transcript_30071:677-1387(-)